MKRIYDDVMKMHFANYRQMAFLSGPRQVGKTTILEQYIQQRQFNRYVNWDNIEDRDALLRGYQNIINALPVDAVLDEKPIIGFDEIHKYRDWRNYLKGFYDSYQHQLDVMVTGSARLHLARRTGDSLMGRYFPYRIHPLSVAELLRPKISDTEISQPREISDALWHQLYKFGGFPEPFYQAKEVFHRKWSRLRHEQLLFNDISQLSQVHELSQLELLATTMKQSVGQLVNYHNFAKHIRVSDQTIRSWIQLLSSFYYCFVITPWHTNVSRSLLKSPKLYLWDWSLVLDEGARLENMVASHLLKAVHFWTDLGLGDYGLYFIRDKDKKEVDFLITKDNQPWCLLEVKSSSKQPLSKHLRYFQEQIKAPIALQLVKDLPYVEKDCFAYDDIAMVSLKTFLSQLV